MVEESVLPDHGRCAVARHSWLLKTDPAQFADPLQHVTQALFPPGALVERGPRVLRWEQHLSFATVRGAAQDI